MKYRNIKTNVYSQMKLLLLKRIRMSNYCSCAEKYSKVNTQCCTPKKASIPKTYFELWLELVRQKIGRWSSEGIKEQGFFAKENLT